jgi:hypothetical protein
MVDLVRSGLGVAIRRLREDKWMQLLVLIVLIGGAMRYWGIRNAENTDEYNEVFEALRIASGRFNVDRWLKKGFQHILAVEYGFYFVFGWLAGIFKSPMHFASAVVKDMNPLFLIGRATVAAMGTASILLTYLFGGKMFNKKTGTLAAFFFAVVPVHVWVSHLVNTDVPMLFFSLLTLYFIWGIASNGSIWSYRLAAFFFAVSLNCKMLAIPLVVPFLLAHWMSWRMDRGGWSRLIVSKKTLYALMFFVIGFLVSNPEIVLGFPKFINYLLYYKDLYMSYEKFEDAIPYSSNAFASYFLMLAGREFGPFLLGFVLVGVIFSLLKREKGDLLLVSLCLAHFLFIAGTNFLVQDRYLMLLIPPALILGARVLSGMEASLRWIRRAPLASMAILCLFFIAPPLTHSLRYVVSLTEDNTSVDSKRWIEENIPPGSKLLMDAGRTLITAGPRLNQSVERLSELAGKIKNLKEGETYDSVHVRMVDSYSAVYFELLLKDPAAIAYDIETTELGTKVESAEYYKQNGYQYFIHNRDLDFRIKDPVWRGKYPRSAEFYDSLKREFELLKTFEPTSTRSGDAIEIYKIR